MKNLINDGKTKVIKEGEDDMFITELDELLARKIDDGVVKQVEDCIKSGQDDEPYFFLDFDSQNKDICLVLSLFSDYGGDYEARIPLMQATKMTTRSSYNAVGAIEKAQALENIALHLRKWADSLEGGDIHHDVPEEAYEEHAKDRASMSEKEKEIEKFMLYCALDEKDQNDTKQ